MTEKEDKFEKTLVENPPDEREKIEKWQSENLDNEKHVKYKAGDKSHLEAIFADVNQDQIEIEENLDREYYRNEILDDLFSSSNLDFTSVDYEATHDERKKDYQNEINNNHFDEAQNSQNRKTYNTKKRKFAEEEKRRKEMIINNRRNQDRNNKNRSLD
jgi:hypothetical protein